MSLERVQELEAKVSAMSEDKARLMATVAKWEAYSATQTERVEKFTIQLRMLRDDIIRNAHDTVWVGMGETACERITSILGDDWGKDGKCEPTGGWKSRQAEQVPLTETPAWKEMNRLADDIEAEAMSADADHGESTAQEAWVQGFNAGLQRASDKALDEQQTIVSTQVTIEAKANQYGKTEIQRQEAVRELVKALIECGGTFRLFRDPETHFNRLGWPEHIGYETGRRLEAAVRALQAALSSNGEKV